MTRGVFVAGNISSSELNAIANHPRVRVFNSANLPLTSGIDTTITFDSERFDSHGLHSTTVNTSRLTIPAGEDGYYLIGCNVNVSVSAVGTRRLALWVNGVTVGTRISHVVLPAVTGAATVVELTTYWPLAAGDYVEMSVLQDSGGGLNAVAAGSYSPELWAKWDAPT